MPPAVRVDDKEEQCSKMGVDCVVATLDSDEKLIASPVNSSSALKLPTVGELRECVPPECFEKSLAKSVMFFVWDIFLLTLLFRGVRYFEAFEVVGLLFWYFVTGMIGFSLFVVGHDCGHGTFSDYEWVNDVFGHLAHAPLLAPYWPWQKSHRLHHVYTSHLTKDKGHPWILEEKFKRWNWLRRFYANNPLSGFIRWFGYTIFGVTDGSHFFPFSRLFISTEERVKCAISVGACVLSATIAFRVCGSWAVFLKYYIGPVISQGFWLTMVTYLQHRTDEITVYEDGTWGFVKGQMETIDRPYGFGIDELMHHITDGHVAHHLFFTQIPHYHLMAATRAIREKLEPLGVYKHNRQNFLVEFCRLNFKLEYLLGKGTGVLRYATKSDCDKIDDGN